MDRLTIMQAWRDACGSEEIAGLPPTGRLLEKFATRVLAAEREAMLGPDFVERLRKALPEKLDWMTHRELRAALWSAMIKVPANP